MVDIEEMLESIEPGDVFAFEQFAPFAQSLDDGAMRTIFETGRLVERVSGRPGVRLVGIRRQHVKLHLVGVARCGDPQVRSAIIERYGPTRELAMGTRKEPGPLRGISGHHWAALAVALTAADVIELQKARILSWTT